MIDRLRRRRATRRRNKVIEGLLASVYWQVNAGLYDVKLDQRAGETPEAHASRELVAANEHTRGALIAIGLMVRNELSARNLLETVEEGAEDLHNQHAFSPTTGAIATLKRTVPGRPE